MVHDLRRVAFWVLIFACLGSAAARAQTVDIDQLVANLKSTDPSKRAAAGFALWDLSGEEPERVKLAIPALTEAVLDRNLNLRWMAMATIKNIGPAAKSAVPALIKALDTFPGGTPALEGPQRYYADARSMAAEALGAMGSDAKAAIPRLQKALRDPSEAVREAAVEALERIEGR